MNAILDECRRLFAPRPLPTGAFPYRSLPAEFPGCWFPEDMLAHYDTLLNFGRVVWGARVQSNYMILDPDGGDEELPGMSVWSPDPYYDDRPGELRAIASTLYAWKGTTPPDTGAAEAVAILTDERDHRIRVPLPPTLTGGRVVFMGFSLFHRANLPARYLVEKVYPVLVCPERSIAHMLLPLRYWSPALVAQSRETAARQAAEQAGDGEVDVTADVLPGGGERLDELEVVEEIPAPPPPPLPAARPGPPAPPPLPLPRKAPAADPAAGRAYLQNPIRLTPAAAAEVRRVMAEKGIRPPAFVRAGRVATPGGPLPTLDVTADPLQPGRDLFQESQGLTVAVDARFAADLAGMVVDVKEAAFGKAFVFRKG